MSEVLSNFTFLVKASNSSKAVLLKNEFTNSHVNDIFAFNFAINLYL